MGDLFGHAKLANTGLAAFDGTTIQQALSLQEGPAFPVPRRSCSGPRRRVG